MKTLSVLPLGCYAVLVAFAIYSFSVIGHWPYYSHPDPSDLQTGWVDDAVCLLSLFGLASIGFLPVIYLVSKVVASIRRRSVSVGMGAFVVYFVGAAVWVLDFAAEHNKLPWHSLAAWILD